jgi:uncharacterized membrane protein required for colicin V production
MTIWILAIVLLGLCAVIGFYSGAIRQVTTLAGLLLAALLARPLGPVVRPLFPMLGVKDPIWVWALPPVSVFALVVILSWVAAYFVHRQVSLHYKYHTDDLHRMNWERLNRQLGICLGLVAGGIYLVALTLPIYIVGYLTVQVSEDSAPGGVRLLNQARADLKATGLDRIVASFDSMPPKYYEVADLLGLLYHNRLLESRMSGYPPFLSLAERQEFQDMAGDTAFLETLKTEQDIRALLANPRIQAVINNSELVQTLLMLDLKDLRQYLETGKSPKYDSEKILGRWELDVDGVLVQMKKISMNITTSQFRRLKAVLTTFMSGMTVTALPDNKVVLKGKFNLAQIVKQMAAQPLVQAQGAPSAPRPVQQAQGMGRAIQMARGLNRYGQQAYTPPAVPVAPTPDPAAPAAPPAPSVLAQGTWQNEDDKYQLALQDDKGKTETLAAVVENDRLIIRQPNSPLVQTLVFTRQE